MRPHVQPSLPIGSRLGPYLLVDLIAVGGMAEVYLARACALDGREKLFALKVIQAELAQNQAFVQMLADEAAVAVGLHHPNITQTFDLGQIGAVHFLSMEYLDGGDFYQLLRDITDGGGDVPMDTALWVAREMLTGLAYAHEKLDDLGQPLGIIHRDVSPQNILLSRGGDVKLVDFGIAKAANVSSSTRAGVIKGKLVYMSPEQSWGDQLDQRSDLFSAGVVLYEALTGGSLYADNNPVRLLQKVRKADIQPPSSRRSEIPPQLDQLVMRALAVRPADRYQDARQFSRALDAYLVAHYPSYDRDALARTVRSVREGGGANLLDSDSMDRFDFPIASHSIIFRGSLAPPAAANQPPMEPNVPDAGNEDAVAAKLVLIEADGSQTTYAIQDQLVIGRGGDLRLSDGRVSRRHARIVAADGAFLLEDLSANGTFINDEKMAETRRLAHGDRIRVGPFKMQFLLDDDTVPRPPLAPALPSPTPSLVVAAAAARAQALAARPEVPPGVPPSSTGQESARSPASAMSQGTDSTTPKRSTRPLESPAASARQAPAPALAPPAELPVSTEGAAPFGVPGLPGRSLNDAIEFTAREQAGGFLIIGFGDDEMRVPLGSKTSLGLQLSAGVAALKGPAGTLLQRGDGFWLEPVARLDRLVLNGKPLDRPVQLASGDRIAVGSLELEFRLR